MNEDQNRGNSEMRGEPSPYFDTEESQLIDLSSISHIETYGKLISESRFDDCIFGSSLEIQYHIMKKTTHLL